MIYKTIGIACKDRNRVVGEFYAESHGANAATGNDAAGQEAYRDSSLQRNQNK